MGRGGRRRRGRGAWRRREAMLTSAMGTGDTEGGRSTQAAKTHEQHLYNGPRSAR